MSVGEHKYARVCVQYSINHFMLHNILILVQMNALLFYLVLCNIVNYLKRHCKFIMTVTDLYNTGRV